MKTCCTLYYFLSIYRISKSVYALSALSMLEKHFHVLSKLFFIHNWPLEPFILFNLIHGKSFFRVDIDHSLEKFLEFFRKELRGASLKCIVGFPESFGAFLEHYSKFLGKLRNFAIRYKWSLLWKGDQSPWFHHKKNNSSRINVTCTWTGDFLRL